MRKKLEKYLRDTVFKIVFGILSILLLNSCIFYWEKDTDASNQIFVENDTKDTLFFAFSTGYNSGYFLPKKKYRIATANDISDFEMIKKYWNKDTVEIYNKDTTLLLTKWYPPLRDMPYNENNFFNKQSWKISKGGYKDKYTIATFTIREEDIK